MFAGIVPAGWEFPAGASDAAMCGSFAPDAAEAGASAGEDAEVAGELRTGALVDLCNVDVWAGA